MCEFCDSHNKPKEVAPVFSSITVESIVGTHIEDAIKEAIAYANSTKDTELVNMNFNGTVVSIKGYVLDSLNIKTKRLTEIYYEYLKLRKESSV
jgi:hypothetical protein